MQHYEESPYSQMNPCQDSEGLATILQTDINQCQFCSGITVPSPSSPLHFLITTNAVSIAYHSSPWNKGSAWMRLPELTAWLHSNLACSFGALSPEKKPPHFVSSWKPSSGSQQVGSHVLLVLPHAFQWEMPYSSVRARYSVFYLNVK